jgi:hypothetical protein
VQSLFEIGRTTYRMRDLLFRREQAEIYLACIETISVSGEKP